MDTMLRGISEVVAFVDDIIVMEANEMDLQKKRDQVLARIAECGFRLCAKRCDFICSRYNASVS